MKSAIVISTIVSSTLAWGGIGGVRGLNEQCTLKWFGEERVDVCQNGIRCVNPPGINFFRVGICKARRGSACKVDTDCDSTNLQCHENKCKRRRTLKKAAEKAEALAAEKAAKLNATTVAPDSKPKSSDEIQQVPTITDRGVENAFPTGNDFPAQDDTATENDFLPSGDIANTADDFPTGLGSDFPTQQDFSTPNDFSSGQFDSAAGDFDFPTGNLENGESVESQVGSASPAITNFGQSPDIASIE